MSRINLTGSHLQLPNFCNVGVMLRTLLLVNALLLAGAGVRTHSVSEWLDNAMLLSAIVEPCLLASLLLLCATRPLLQGLSYRGGLLVVAGIELVFALMAWRFIQQVGPVMFGSALPLGKVIGYFAFTTIFLFLYFDLRGRALSPAITEARLQALQARIRPHFLFNSINAVLSLIRSEPKRAEAALIDMADLFRVLMKENRELTTLEREVALTEQYLGLEQLRLGERLKVSWHIEKMPKRALVPPLILQPLTENAVYHGIEPLPDGGELVISIFEARDQVVITVTNPLSLEPSQHEGNRMATANIRERLALHFDAEASMTAQSAGGKYTATIKLPLSVAPASPKRSAVKEAK